MIQESYGQWVQPGIITDRIDSSFYKKEDIDALNVLVCSGLELKNLMEMSAKISDGPHDGYTFIDQGVLFIRSQNIKNMGFDLSDKKYISDEFNCRCKKSWLELGDLLITRIGEYYGNAAVVSSEFVGCNINHAIAKVKLLEKYDPYYVSSYVHSSLGNKLYRRLGKSFTSPRVNLSDFEQFLVPIPPRNVQQYIGNKVRKAEELREEAKLLRGKAENLYDDCVGVLNSKRRMVRNTDVKLLDNDTWAPVFFDSLQILERSNLTFVTLNNVQRNIKCGEPVKKDDRIGQSYPFYGASGISDAIGSYNFDGQYLIIAQDGSIGCVSVANGKFWANNHVWVVEIDEGWNPYFLSLYLNRYPYWYCLTTGSVVPKLTSENLRKLLIPIIPIEIQNLIGDWLANAEERQSLAGKLIQEAKLDVKDLIEDKFDKSKISEGV